MTMWPALGNDAVKEGEMSGQEQDLGFAPEHDTPIPYMRRIHDYYVALGYIAGHISSMCRFSR